MKKLVSRGRSVSIIKDVEVEVDVYLEDFETEELVEELKRRKDYIDYKALYEELGWYITKMEETQHLPLSTEFIVKQMIREYRGNAR